LKDTYHIDQNPHKGNRGLVRAWHAAKNSWRGLVFAFKEESAFRQELSLFIVLSPIAVVLPVPLFEKAVLICSIVLVMAIELLNSSVEAAIDRISFEHHDLSKRAKDFGSAAVMLALLISFILWVCVCLPLFMKLS
jgi:diacylglycerol kinase (ATP)